MSTTQELIERLKAWADRERDAARGFDDALSFAAMEACEITEGTLRAAADRLASLSAELDALKAREAGLREIVRGAASMRLIDAEDIKGEIVFRFTMPGNQLFNPPKFFVDARAAHRGAG